MDAAALDSREAGVSVTGSIPEDPANHRPPAIPDPIAAVADEDGLTAGEAPALRRGLVEYMRSDYAAMMFTLMIHNGRQPIRPPGTFASVGQLLAQTEADRLQRADLWHIDADLADLVDAAYPSMPAFAPKPYDLPSRHGFVTFARPLTTMMRDAIPDDRRFAEQAAQDGFGNTMLTQMMPHMDEPVPLVAVSWGPAEESAAGIVGRVVGSHRSWRGRPGVWMSFWSMGILQRKGALPDGLSDRERAGYGVLAGPLQIDNECLVEWCPDSADEADYLMGPGTRYSGTATWAAAVMATFALARQGNVAEQDEQVVPRPERRRHKHAGLPEPRTVRILRLRRGVAAQARAAAGAGGAGREYRHRWVVRGHWRNQFYPSIAAHRPKWIAPYLAGPADAPLLGGDKVVRVSAPAQPDPDPDTDRGAGMQAGDV